MFYSNEVLTSRKYGVATVWLVATLGAKSSLKKINRKQILDVDVAKACQTIVDPSAPMALRLQGNLLYGVSRVYLQQCGYVLSDAQYAQQSINLMIKTLKNAALDPDAGKARPEQLILPDDPSFLPEFALPPVELLTNLNHLMPLGTTRTSESQSLTPFGTQKQPSTPAPVGGLIIPSSSSHAQGGFQYYGDDSLGSIDGNDSTLANNMGALPVIEDDWAYDEEGNLIDYPNNKSSLSAPVAPGGGYMPSDAAASAKVRREHEEGHQAGQQDFAKEMNIDFPPIVNDDIMDVEAFPSGQRPAIPTADIMESSSVAAAPMRPKRSAPRVIPADTSMELRNRDLADWNRDYLKNMEGASRAKHQQRALQQAKKNAEYYLWNAGIGGIGHRLGGPFYPTPLDRFRGNALFELFTGIDLQAVAGNKHDRDSGIDDVTQEEARRVRHKSHEYEFQVGQDLDNEVMFLPQDDVEFGREAPPALDDEQGLSAMPWNLSASVRGSSAVPRSGTGVQGSLGRPRTSRLVSASPLQGRGHSGGLDALQGLEGGDEYANMTSDDYGFAPRGHDSDDIDMEPPPANKIFNRVREALPAEDSNFLIFVSNAITEKRRQALVVREGQLDRMQTEHTDDIYFEELLPQAETTRVVAAQGLLMILTLGTKGLLEVKQDEDFGEICLLLTDKAQALQTENIPVEQAEGVGGDNDDNDDDDIDEGIENMEQEEDEVGMAGLAGDDKERDEQPEEQFVPQGDAEVEQDDHDNL